MGAYDHHTCDCGRTGQVRGAAWLAVDRARDLELAVRRVESMTEAERAEVLSCLASVDARARAMGRAAGEGER